METRQMRGVIYAPNGRINVQDLGRKMGVRSVEVIKQLWALGHMGVTIRDDIDVDTACVVASTWGYEVFESVSMLREPKFDVW